jgi:hypothetical protein
MGVIDDLTKDRENKYDFLDSLVMKLYEKCLNEVKFENKGGIRNMTYTTPVLLPGYPVYNQEEATLLLNKMLKKKGFKTIFCKPNSINISW